MVVLNFPQDAQIHSASSRMCIPASPESGFGEQPYSLGSLVSRPWVWARCCHSVTTQECPVSSGMPSLGHRELLHRTVEVPSGLSSLQSDSLNTWHIKNRALGFKPPWVMSWHKNRSRTTTSLSLEALYALMKLLPRITFRVGKPREMLWHHTAGKLNMWHSAFPPSFILEL